METFPADWNPRQIRTDERKRQTDLVRQQVYDWIMKVAKISGKTTVELSGELHEAYIREALLDLPNTIRYNLGPRRYFGADSVSYYILTLNWD